MTTFIHFGDKQMDEKSGILKDNGFHYDFDRDLFINPSTSTITSVEFVEDHPPQIIRTLTAPNLTNQPIFAFNTPPSEEEKELLLKRFNLGAGARQGKSTIPTMQQRPVTPGALRTEKRHSLGDEYESNFRQFEKLARYGEASVSNLLKDVQLSLKGFERVEIKSRIKALPKCIGKLEKRNEGNLLAPNASILSLDDIVGIRVTVFPNNRIREICEKIMTAFPNCVHKTEPGRCNKYYIQPNSDMAYKTIEVQIVPSLLSAYWDIEHDLIYKPTDIAFSKAQEMRIKKLDDEIEAFIIEKSRELNEIIQHEDGGP